MARRSVAGLLPVDFFTRGYRISGYLSTRAKSVGDMLNDHLQSYMDLEQVYISRIINPGDIVATYDQAKLRKDNLIFAIMPIAESLSKVTRSVSYFSRHHIPVWLALPMVEIEGDLHATGISFDLDVFLARGTGDYITLLNATARAASWPEISFTGEAFMVNKNFVDLFCTSEAGSE